MGFIINNPAARNAKKYYQQGSAPEGSKPDATPKGPRKVKPVPKGKGKNKNKK